MRAPANTNKTITDIIRNVKIDLKKSDNILGVIANIRWIVFSEQS